MDVLDFDAVAQYVRHRFCKVCRKNAREAGPISARGKCKACAEARQMANNAQLRSRRGPFFEQWYDSLHLAFEHRRLDETQAQD